MLRSVAAFRIRSSGCLAFLFSRQTLRLRDALPEGIGTNTQASKRSVQKTQEHRNQRKKNKYGCAHAECIRKHRPQTSGDALKGKSISCEVGDSSEPPMKSVPCRNDRNRSQDKLEQHLIDLDGGTRKSRRERQCLDPAKPTLEPSVTQPSERPMFPRWFRGLAHTRSSAVMFTSSSPHAHHLVERRENLEQVS